MADALNVNTLVGAIAGLLLKFVWDRFMGTDQKSVPTMLAEIHVKLADIKTTTQLIRKDLDHGTKESEELKNDFWNHMDKYHSVAYAPPRSASGPVARPGDSGIHQRP